MKPKALDLVRSLEDLSEDSRRIIQVVNDEPDFAVAIITTSYLDSCLAALLRRFLHESSITEELLKPDRGALGTFTARAKVAYALGLVPKALYQDLATIAEIRNMFAHNHLGVSFDDVPVSTLCEKLRYVKTFPVKTNRPDLLGTIPEPPRAAFVWAAVIISHRLMGIASRTIRLRHCTER